MQVPVLGGHREVALLPKPQEELDGFFVEFAGVGGVSALLKVCVDLIQDATVLRGGLLLGPPVCVGDVLVDARYSGVVALCHDCHSLQCQVVESFCFKSAYSGFKGEEPCSFIFVEYLEGKISNENSKSTEVCSPVGPVK